VPSFRRTYGWSPRVVATTLPLPSSNLPAFCGARFRSWRPWGSGNNITRRSRLGSPRADSALPPSITWLGHSLGGQILGLVPNRDRISKMITIACGSGYWLENPVGLRLRVWWLWYVAAPLSVRMLGRVTPHGSHTIDSSHFMASSCRSMPLAPACAEPHTPISKTSYR
jgi:hypothetical protein